MDIINWKEALFPYEQATNELYVKFNSIKKEFASLDQHSPIELVQTRVKSISSILDKANKKDINLNKIFENIQDIAGVRITCKFVEDIYKVVQLIRDRDGKDLIIKEEEDYINNTKSSGYRSYHITIKYNVIMATGVKQIPCEIQIRTMAMNFWATIEHSLRYKYNGNMPQHLKSKLEACATACFKLDTEMGTIRDEIIQTQQIIKTKEYLVENILKNIQNLYFTGKIADMNRFNKEFIDLYQEGGIDELTVFNDMLEVMADLYKVNHI